MQQQRQAALSAERRTQASPEPRLARRARGARFSRILTHRRGLRTSWMQRVATQFASSPCRLSHQRLRLRNMASALQAPSKGVTDAAPPAPVPKDERLARLREEMARSAPAAACPLSAPDLRLCPLSRRLPWAWTPTSSPPRIPTSPSTRLPATSAASSCRASRHATPVPAPAAPPPSPPLRAGLGWHGGRHLHRGAAVDGRPLFPAG